MFRTKPTGLPSTPMGGSQPGPRGTPMGGSSGPLVSPRTPMGGSGPLGPPPNVFNGKRTRVPPPKPDVKQPRKMWPKNFSIILEGP